MVWLPKNKFLLFIIITGIILRLGYILFFTDLKECRRWEYGAIADNIASSKGYSLFYINQGNLDYHNNLTVDANPSAYMMPGYVGFLLPFSFIKDRTTGNALILMIHALLSGLVALLLYHITLKHFGDKIALLTAAIYSLLPEFIYSSGQIGITVVFHLGIVLILYNLSRIGESSKSIYYSGLSILFLIYIKPEIALFLLFILVSLMLRRNYKHIIILLSIVILGLSPWIARNYFVFNKFIPLTTSTGINYYRGHNPYFPGFWTDVILDKQIREMRNSKDFELKLSDLYLKEARNSFSSDFYQEITNSLNKFLHLWVFYPYDSRSGNLIYLIPWIIMLMAGIWGIWHNFDLKKYKYYYLFFLSTSVTAIIFFAIPRYQTMMKILLIPFAAYTFYSIYTSLRQLRLNKNKNKL